MLPSLTKDYFADASQTYFWETTRDLFRSKMSHIMQPANLKNFFRGEFGLRAILAMACSTFGGAVSHVLGLRSRKEMDRVDARSIVAFVANEKAVVQESFVNLIGVPMRLAVDLLSAFGHLPKLAMPMRPLGARPHPALSKLRFMRWNRTVLVHLFPESFLFRCHAIKTPITPEVMSARVRGNRDDGWKSWCCSIFTGNINAVQPQYTLNLKGQHG